MIIFYHSSDEDGRCSGAIVKIAHPEARLYGIDHGDEFPWDEIQDQDVVMVDFSLPTISDMLKLKKESKSFTWIDHHISAIKETEGHEFDGVRDSDFAGCENAWNYYFPDKPMPETVKLIGRYDVWDHSDPRSLTFHYGLQLYMTYPGAYIDLWKEWFKNFPEDILKEGEVVERFVERDNARYTSSCSFETELDGFKCIAVNKLITNSQLFDSVWNEEKYDIMLTFGLINRKWKISLYSTKEDVDVSKIAKSHGGGGHKGAAGFMCDELPFDF